MTVWTTADISFEFVDDMADDPIVTLPVTTPAGLLTFMAEPVMSGTTMMVNGLHAQDPTPNAVGPGNLMMIAQAVRKEWNSMNSSLRDRFARLGPVRAVDRVTSGSPAIFVLRLPLDDSRPRTIDATHALARRGMTMLRAKRAVEALAEKGRVFVELPTVEDTTALTDDLARAGIAAAWIEPDPTVNVRELRERLQLTREQFAIRYGLELETVRNWETGKREPDTTARSYLRAISNAPEPVEQAYAPTPRR